jgi:hypothetical protein
VTSPHHLHALTASWSLRAARHHLAQRIDDTTHHDHHADDGLRSPTWGTRTALGGHGDPVATLVLATNPTGRPNRWITLAADITNRLAVPAAHLPGTGDPLDRIHHAIPAMSTTAAQAVTVLLRQLDNRVRRDLGIGPDEQLLTGARCPDCGDRQLYTQHSAPRPAGQTVICRATRCDGIWPLNALTGTATEAA